MTTVKSDASLRTVNLAGVLLEHLRAHRARHSGSDDALVFARGSLADAQRGHRGPQDAPFSDHTVGERARRVWARAGIELVESVTLHVARHSYTRPVGSRPAERRRGGQPRAAPEFWLEGAWRTLSNGVNARRSGIPPRVRTRLGGIYRGGAHGGTSITYIDDFRGYRVG